MQHTPITTAQTVKRAILYALMTIAVMVSAAVLVLFTLGYRFDRTDNRVEQVGLVQFGSQPTGAQVHIEGVPFNKTTNTKTTLPQGTYTIEMRKDGYTTWRKSVPVTSGTIVWLTYPRLLPKKLEPTAMLAMDKLVSSAASSDNRYLATTTPSRDMNIYDLGSSKLAKVVIPLEPARSFEADQPTYHVKSWSADSSTALVKRSSKNKTQWLIVNRRDKSVLNINTELGIAPSEVQFQPSDNRYLYVLTDGELRRVDIKRETLSRVYASNVKSFSIHDTSVIYTTTTDKATKQRSIGLLRDGIELPIVLETVNTSSEYYGAVLGEYYGDSYIAIVHGKDLRIYSGKLSAVRADGDFVDSYQLAYETSLDSSAQDIAFKNNGRFVAIAQGDSFSVYDIEMQRLTVADDATLDGWLDGYMTYSDASGSLGLQEFDGGNHRAIGSSIAGQAVTYDDKGENLYWFQQSKAGVPQLMRAKLRI